MVPRAGLEPARYRYRWILSPLRLPISPPGQKNIYLILKMVPRAGLEPARYRYRWILSPLRLPISPPGHCLTIISKDRMPCKDFFKKATRNSINKKMHPKQMHQMILLKFNIYLLIFSSFEISYSFINS